MIPKSSNFIKWVSESPTVNHDEIQNTKTTTEYPKKAIKHLKRLYMTGGKILEARTEISERSKKIKVLIFANCHGVYYKNALTYADQKDELEVDHVISYENLSNFEKIQPKFSECDILIIQPVSNYEDFKIQKIQPLLKSSCQLIRIPFIRFYGFWNPGDIRDLVRFTKSAVMFFPKISTPSEVETYLTGNHFRDDEIQSNFDSEMLGLRDLEGQGDIEFVDFFINNYKELPLFRDPWHPTMVFLNYLSTQLVKKVKLKVPDLVVSEKLSTIWKKEYGHFKPIVNSTANKLGLNYDLDSYYQYSRKNYLEKLIAYENHEDARKIDDLEQLKSIIDQEQPIVTEMKSLDDHSINLFTPYYRSQNEARRKELSECLRRNVENSKIKKIYLMIDDGQLPEIESDKIEIINIEMRPTYSDWIRLTREKFDTGVSILANSDIYFDDSVDLIPYLLTDNKSFVALSRYEIEGDRHEAHKNPQWSQDVWAISAQSTLPQSLIKSLDLPMGVPRCDNKVAYLFSIHGFKIYNPYYQIKSYHIHSSQLRGYDKKQDRTILGGVAYVYPCQKPGSPSRVDIQIWGSDFSQVSKIAMNKTIEFWDREMAEDGKKSYIPTVDCILIPVIKREIPDLVRYLQTMIRPSANKINLVLSMDTIWTGDDIKLISELVGSHALDEYFHDPIFISCNLSDEESIYVRGVPKDIKTIKIPSHGLKTGPNKQFFTSINKIREIGLNPNAVILQEVDTIPLRQYWLDSINQLTRKYNDPLLIGATCTALTPLSRDLKDHVNGNAILCFSNPDFNRFIALWEKLLIEVVKKAPWKAYDSATEWVLHYLENDIEFTLDGRQLRETDFFCSNEFREYLKMYHHHVHRSDFLLNLADAPRSKSGFLFDFKSLLPKLGKVDVIHLRAALPHRDVLRAHADSTWTNAIIYDAHWQYPAITEKHAAYKAKDLLQGSSESIYFGFPWATLIDKLLHNKDESVHLLEVLKIYAPVLKKYTRVMTTCQHVYMLRFQEIFQGLGITDVFWSHAVKCQTVFPDYPNISIHPFPLYPVQRVDPFSGNQHQKYLFSFVGAKSPSSYLTLSRNKILNLLSSDRRGYVKGRDSWHYKQIVYEHQIKGNVNDTANLVCDDSSKEFKDMLSRSIFTLCPSGSGPNSIRLWETIESGSIPVILADTYLPPGNMKLWEKAVVFCKEDDASILALPDQLEAIASDPILMAGKRRALRQIKLMYGLDCFIHDIQKLSASSLDRHVQSPSMRKDPYINDLISAVLDSKKSSPVTARSFLIGCGCRMLSDPHDFFELFQQAPDMQEACAIALQKGPSDVVKQFKDIAAIKNLRLFN